VTSSATAPARLSRWRAGPARLARLGLGLWLFGTGEGTVIGAGLGNSPWTVLSEGVSKHTPLSVGTATIAVSFAVILLWIPLRQPPGLGTIANAALIGVAIDVTLGYLPDDPSLPLALVELFGGILLVGIGSGFYLLARLGPGPRDGLMVGIHRRFDVPVGLARTVVEVSVVFVGFLLGGTAGLGSLAFALLIGPLVAAILRSRGVVVNRL
jgi:uncharacterized membrane protein YczE